MLREETEHRERLYSKVQRIQGKEAILAMWEECSALTEEDVEYIRELRQRIRKTQNELKNMRP
jgi:hypothetical protein